MTVAHPPWRRRLSDLGRAVGPPHPPLFAPLTYGVCARIEALPPADVTADPTRLAKCQGELRRVLGTAAHVLAAPSAMEAEALGAAVDRGVWPPRVTGAAPARVVETTDFDAVWSRSEALSASLEACRRLAATEAGEPPMLVALTGPLALLDELLGRDAAHDAAALAFAGRALAALAGRFARHGASAILVCERRLPADGEPWRDALTTIANIARFHRLPALLAFDGEDEAEGPAALVACPSRHERAPAKPHGFRASADPARWAELPGNTGSARIVVTARDIAADSDIETLADACADALAMERAS